MKNYPEPRINHIDVKITYACNYKCEYCYQVNSEGQRQKGVLSKEHAENLLHFVDRMEEKFHVTFAGGEPFVYPHLNYLAEGFAKRQCSIMLITNFSAPIEKMEEFVLLCGKHLTEFNISVHLSQWDSMDVFYDKLERFCAFIKEQGLPARVNLTCVVTDENFEEVKCLDEVMGTRFEKLNFKLHRVYYNGIYHMYKDEVEEYLQSKNLDVPKERANNIDFYGRMCWCGSRFFYIESNGDVMRCYTSQKNPKMFHLGNLNDYQNVNILEGPSPCLSRDNGKCVCYEHFENCKLVTCEMADEEEILKACENNEE